MKRGLAFCVSVLMLLGLCRPLAAQATAPAVLMRFSAAEKTFSLTNTAEKHGALSTDWCYADGTDASAGVDLSAHKAENLRLEMTMQLTAAENDAPDEKRFAGGQAQLRSPDNNGEQNSRWLLVGQQLKLGENRLSFSFSDLTANNGQVDLSAVNRFRLYIDSLNNYTGRFTMTLSQVLYSLWLGANLQAKITRSARPLESALAHAKQIIAAPAV